MNEREYPSRPIVGIGVVVRGSDGVLLVRRANPPRQGEWSLPGGAQELGETVAEAARREVAEETGLSIEVLGLIDVVDSVKHDDGGGVRFHYTLIEVLAAVRGGRLAPGGDAAEACWFRLDEIPELGLWPETRRIIELGEELFAALDVDGGD